MPRDEEIIRSHEDWLTSAAGSYVNRRQRELLISLIVPQRGERLLDVGCKTGRDLLFFKRQGCAVTGVDSSRFILERARKKIGNHADLHRGDCEDLPFSDNEFDIVTLITSLESADNPQRAIEEAIRVSGGRVFICILNKYSFSAASMRDRGALCCRVPSQDQSFSLFDVIHMIKGVLKDIPIQWGSAIFLPISWYPNAAGIEEKIPMAKNPFGSLVGLSFSVSYTHSTIQEPLKDSLKARLGGKQRVPETVTQEMKREQGSNAL